jgi:hypothetical protein
VLRIVAEAAPDHEGGAAVTGQLPAAHPLDQQQLRRAPIPRDGHFARFGGLVEALEPSRRITRIQPLVDQPLQGVLGTRIGHGTIVPCPSSKSTQETASPSRDVTLVGISVGRRRGRGGRTAPRGPLVVAALGGYG